MRKGNEEGCRRNGSIRKKGKRKGKETREADCYILPPFRPDSVLRGCRLMIEVF